jgi:hypothetical protein
MFDTFTNLLDTSGFLIGWALLSAGSLAVLLTDYARRNPGLGTLMKWVWGLTVAYSGPVGLAIYWVSGRKQIPRDANWRRACRSVAHCYSGCGGGEVAGVLIAAGLLGLGNLWIAGISFTLAYVAGIGLTVGPLLQEGESLDQALEDAFISETASIAVMEAVAIGVDLLLARSATMGDPIFWSSIIVSLTAGLVAAYPVNLWLVARGVKEGMADPTERRRERVRA